MNVLMQTLSTVTFRVPEWGTVTIIELFWTLIGAFGMSVTLYALRQIQRDRVALDLGNGSMTAELRKAAGLVWRSHLRREVLRLVQMVGIVGVGIWAMLQPSLVHPSVITVTGLIITGVFITVVAITVVQSIQDSRVQREITLLLK